jgi:formamidopyrimidine-DNA glycosylase
MPELPEVETMRRGILPIVGASIVRAERTPCQRRPIHIAPSVGRIHRRLQGLKITAIERLGKRVVIRLANDDRLILEPRMTGLVLIEAPPTREHLRFRLSLSGVGIPEVLYWDRRGLGRVYLLTGLEYQTQLLSGKLGPDALEIRLPEFQERLGRTHRPIKVALLDQGLLAGVGNLYASEILHLARVDPRLPSDALSGEEIQLIFKSMRQILREAIRKEGSTLSDGTYRNALNKSGGYQNLHRVYDREGECCSRCRKHPIIRIVQSQRSTFFCEHCQVRS